MEISQEERLRCEILKMCKARGIAKTVCPSEVVRKLYPDCWRDKMSEVRSLAIELAKLGKIYITQKGNIITDYKSIKGPIRLKIAQKN